eukprot:10915701-Alexandrium_andersonii.AAC.1
MVDRDMLDLGLRKGDRLEPNDDLPDIGLYESLDAFPRTVLFWRPSRETKVRHRNPLFDGPTHADVLGISVLSLAIDTLHTLNLGVYQEFVKAA